MDHASADLASNLLLPTCISSPPTVCTKIARCLGCTFPTIKASMGLSLPCLLPFLLLAILSWLPFHTAQSLSSSTIASARSLDAILQDYAYRAFINPKTGTTYDGSVPSNLTGIKISGVRLRSGSLRYKGVKSYKEFEIPIGVASQPYVERLVLVYQNLGNWSTVYYPLDGYSYISPVLGLLAYNAANLSATSLSELDIHATSNPILIHHSDVRSIKGRVPKCVWFDLNGSANLSSVVSDNTCSTTSQGHFALVVEGTIPPPPGSLAPTPGHKKHKVSSKVWIIIGSVLGGLLLLILFAILLAWLKKYEHRKKMQRMEKAADVGEALRVTSVGTAKAPSAVRTRTQPSLETEYISNVKTLALSVKNNSLSDT
ncbi:hypothetical protein V2J09_012175 [Rumex salicifolius]